MTDTVRFVWLCENEDHRLEVSDWPFRLNNFDPECRWAWDVSDVKEVVRNEEGHVSAMVTAGISMHTFGKAFDRETALKLARTAHVGICPEKIGEELHDDRG